MSNSNDRSNHHSQNGSQHSNNGNGKNWSQFGNRSRFPRNSNSRNGSGYSGNSYHSNSQSQESNHSSRSGSQRSSQGGRLYAYRQKSGGDGKLITIPPHHKKNFNKSIGRGKKFDKEREEQEKQQIINDYIQSQKEKGINVNEDTITYEQVCEKMSQSPFVHSQSHSQSQQGSTKASEASNENNNNNNGIIKNNDIVNNNSNNNGNGGSYRRNNTFSQRSYQSNHSNHSDRSHHSNNSFHRNGSSVRSHQSNNSNHSNGSYKNSPNNQSYFRNNSGNENNNNNNNNNNNTNNNTNSSTTNGNNNRDEGYRGGRGRGRGRGRPYQSGNDNSSQRSNDSHHSNGSRFGIGDRNVRFRNSPKSDNSRNNKNNNNSNSNHNSASPNINNRNNGNNNNDNNGQTTSNIIGNKNNCYFNSNSPPTARNSLNNNNSQNTSQSPMPPNFASPTAQQTTASLLYQPRLIQDSPSEFSRQTALRNMTNLSGTQPSLLMGNSPGPVFTTPQPNQQGQGQARGTPLSNHTAAFNTLGMINPFGGNQQGISSPTNQLSPTFNLSNVNNVQAQRLLGNVTNMANMANMNTVGSMTNTMNGVLPNIASMPGLTSFNNMNMNMNMNGMNFGLLGGNNNNNNNVNNVNNVQQLLSPTQGVQGSNNFSMTGQLNTNGVNNSGNLANKIVGMASGGLGQTTLIQQPQQQQQQGSNVGTNVTNTAETTPNDSAAPVNAHSEEDGFNEEYSHGSYSDRYKSETPQQYHSYRDYAASNRHNNNNVHNGNTNNTNNNNNNSGKIENGNSSNVNDTSNKHRGSVNGNGDMNRNETESEYIARNNGRLYGDERNNGLKSKEKDLERYLPKDLLSEMADDSGRSSNGVMNTGNNNSTGRGGLRYKPKSRVSDMNDKRNKDEQGGCGKSVPLIENTQLCNDLKDCLDDNNGDFLIVGIIGKQGVGKSLILSCLASNDASMTSSTSSKIFNVGNIKTFTHGSHVTNGIDAYVSRENIIFLDCEPIFSSSTLSNATQHVEQQMFARDKQGRKRPSYEEFESYDNYGYHAYGHSSNRHAKHEDETAADQAMKIWETEMYKQSVFLASICHVLLVVSDTLNDRKTWDFLRAIYDLRQSLKINSFLKPMRPKYWNLKSSLHDSNNGNHNSNGNNNNNSSNGNNGNNGHNNDEMNNEYENNYRISDKMNNILSSENEEYGIHEIMNEAPSRLQAFPDIVFVFNKLESMDMNAATYQDTKRNLLKYFENQRFDIYGEISNPQFVSVIHKNENESKRKVNEKLKYKYASAKIDDMRDRFGDTLTIDDKYDESGKINCFFLPSVNENDQMFFEECDKLREQLLSVSRRLTTKEMSQVEWFDYVTTVWNEIDNSNKISQFRLSNSLTNDDLMKQPSSHSGGAPNRNARRMLH